MTRVVNFWKRFFFFFFAKFLPFLLIFQSSALPLACSTLKNHQKLGKKWRKAFFNLPFNPISPWHFQLSRYHRVSTRTVTNTYTIWMVKSLAKSFTQLVLARGIMIPDNPVNVYRNVCPKVHPPNVECAKKYWCLKSWIPVNKVSLMA